jgi:hypothetical protein
MKLKLKAEENGQTEEVASIEVKEGVAIITAGGRRFRMDKDDAQRDFISITTLEVNQL